MAKIGARLPVIARISDEGDANSYPSYVQRISLGKLVEMNESLNFADVTLDADDDVEEEDHSFIDGELTATIDQLTKIIESTIYDITPNEDRGLEFGALDSPVYCGMVFLKTMKKKGVLSWVGYYYPKIAAVPQGESMRTKGGTISFEGEQVKFKVRTAKIGKYRCKEYFTTLEDAMEWYETVMPTVAPAGTTTATPSGN